MTLRKLILAIGAVILLGLGGLAALPLFLSAETIRNELAARIEAATGRVTRIDGPVTFSVFPTARFSAEGIGIAGLAEDTEAFSVESISFGLSLLPLLGGNIEIHGLTLTQPVVLLTTDESGRSNWSFAEDEPPPDGIEAMIAAAPEPVADEGATGDAIAVLDRLSIGRVTINDGRFIWRDATNGQETEVSDIDLDISVPELDGAGTIEGEFTHSGVRQALKLDIGERPDPTRFESVPVDLSLTSEAGSIAAKGVALAEDTTFNGTIEVAGESLLQFARGFGAELPSMPAFGQFEGSAQISATEEQIQIAQYTVDLAGMSARGGAAIAIDRSKPGIGLKIAAERIDTALFVAGDTKAGSGGSANEATGEDRLDISALNLVDANVDISVAELVIGSVPLTNVDLNLQVAGGGLDATLRSATINGSPGSGRLVIDNSGAEPSFAGDATLSGLDAAGLAAVTGLSIPIDAGSLALDASFSTRGVTTAALIANLSAKGSASLSNGHLSGLDLANLVGGDTAANEIDDVDIVAEFSSLEAPGTAKGGFTWRGERFNVSGTGSLRALAAGKTSPIEIAASSARVNFGFNGEAGLSGVGQGSVNLTTPSLRNLLAWVGQPIAPGGGLEAFSIEGAVKLSATAFAFENASFRLDNSNGVGTGTFTYGDTPKLAAGLAMKVLDVTPYLVASGASEAGNGAAPGGNSGWSKEPIGFDGLRAIDAQLNFNAEQIVAGDIRIGPASLTASLAGGKLSAELAEMALYSGRGAGTLTVDGASATPSVAASFRLLDVSAVEFLQDALGFSRVDGRGSFAFDLSASGASEAALVAALDGDGTIDIRNGSIRGIDIPQMVRSLSIETLLGWQSGGQSTDFSQLAGTFTISDGILTNDDLVLIGPLLRVTGAGRVDIPSQTLAYRVDPKVVASLEGQGGADELEGFAVPIRVEGSWSSPRIYPEIEGILQDPQKAFDQLRKLGGGLFGNANEAAPQAEASESKSLEDRLKEEALKGLGKLLDGQPASAPQQAPHSAPLAQPAPPPEAMPAATEQAPLDLMPAPAEPVQTSGEPAAAAPLEPAPADPATQLLRSIFGQ